MGENRILAGCGKVMPLQKLQTAEIFFRYDIPWPRVVCVRLSCVEKLSSASVSSIRPLPTLQLDSREVLDLLFCSYVKLLVVRT